MLNKLPDEIDLDDFTYQWLYYSYLEDTKEENEKMKAFGIFVGAFSNYKMAEELSKTDNNNYKLSEDDVKKTEEYIDAFYEKQPNKSRLMRKRGGRY